MNEFVAFLGRQLAADARSAAPRVRARLSDQRVQRCGTIAELRAAARRGVPRVMFDFVDGGAEDEVTIGHNRSDLAELEIVPRMLADVSSVDLSTTVLGEPVAVPLLSAPMGLNGLVHHDGELGIARAVHDAGSVFVLAAMASYSIEEIAHGAPGATWLQMYLWKDRGLVAELMQRAAAVGQRVLVLTVDVPRPAARDRDRRNGFGFPPRMTMRTLAGGLARPRWSAQFIRYPRMTTASVSGHGGGAQDPVTITEYIGRQFDSATTWDDITWFRERWDGPLAIKGLLHPDDARRAVSLGFDAIIVSNHGGRQLDHAVSSIRALGPIVDAVGADAEVLLDSGIRRGSDIFKALALGARACLAGRPFAYGLGAGGETGARRAMTILTEELRATMGLAGCPSVTALDSSWVRDRRVPAVPPPPGERPPSA
ncbi:MAG TPA: alpha-hydroxy acid oxidase [Solirubrobacteraceae bacterium]|nr:alpha-hydroxy acid oxidase [Solirubrobacteraceae bacterium]